MPDSSLQGTQLCTDGRLAPTVTGRASQQWTARSAAAGSTADCGHSQDWNQPALPVACAALPARSVDPRTGHGQSAQPCGAVNCTLYMGQSANWARPSRLSARTLSAVESVSDRRGQSGSASGLSDPPGLPRQRRVSPVI